MPFEYQLSSAVCYCSILYTSSNLDSVAANILGFAGADSEASRLPLPHQDRKRPV